MSFITMSDTSSKPMTSLSSHVLSEGEPNAKLCFIGECPGRTELKTRRPFSGDAGSIFDHCLHGAGLIRGQQYITTAVKEMPSPNLNAYINDKTKRLTEKGLYWQQQLAEELADIKADILLPMGRVSTACLTGTGDVTSRRGYVTTSLPMFGSRPVLPTLSPASCSYGGNYINKYYITHDMHKASKIINGELPSEFPDTNFIFLDTVQDVKAMADIMRKATIFAFDIEVSNYEVSAVSFCSNIDTGYAVLFCDEHLWTQSEETEIWRIIASILEDVKLSKVGQNLIFDINFLQTHQHIFVKGPIIDTMIGHHLIYPDFLKGLGFLASIYTHRPYWKDMVSFKNIKKES